MDEPLEVTVDGTSYLVAGLSAAAQAQVANLRFVDAEIARLHAKLAVYATARHAYDTALREQLPRALQ